MHSKTSSKISKESQRFSMKVDIHTPYHRAKSAEAQGREMNPAMFVRAPGWLWFFPTVQRWNTTLTTLTMWNIFRVELRVAMTVMMALVSAMIAVE